MNILREEVGEEDAEYEKALRLLEILYNDVLAYENREDLLAIAKEDQEAAGIGALTDSESEPSELVKEMNYAFVEFVFETIEEKNEYYEEGKVHYSGSKAAMQTSALGEVMADSPYFIEWLDELDETSEVFPADLVAFFTKLRGVMEADDDKVRFKNYLINLAGEIAGIRELEQNSVNALEQALNKLDEADRERAAAVAAAVVAAQAPKPEPEPEPEPQTEEEAAYFAEARKKAVEKVKGMRRKVEVQEACKKRGLTRKGEEEVLRTNLVEAMVREAETKRDAEIAAEKAEAAEEERAAAANEAAEGRVAEMSKSEVVEELKLRGQVSLSSSLAAVAECSSLSYWHGLCHSDP